MNTTRREFLVSSMVAGAITITDIAIAASNRQSPVSPRNRWKSGLGLNGFMSSGQQFQKTYPIWEVLDFAATEGFDGIELVDGWPMGGYPPPKETKRVAALKRLYDQYGLSIYSIQTGGPAAYSADANARWAWLRSFADQVQLCQQLGCQFIGHWPGGGLEGNPDVEHAIKCLVASYREAAKICADAGMYMSFEIEPPFVFNTLEHLQRILAEVDHPACKTNYDPSHFDIMWGSKGKPEEMLKQVGVNHIGHVHLTDTDGTMFGGTSRHLSCGEGHCDIHASLKTLWDGGYKGWIMIDGWKIEDVYRAARKGKQAIDKAQHEFS